MSRYFSAPRAKQPAAVWDDYGQPLITTITVDDHEAVNTGLLDQRGDSIMRAPNPMGFGRDGEW